MPHATASSSCNEIERPVTSPRCRTPDAPRPTRVHIGHSSVGACPATGLLAGWTTSNFAPLPCAAARHRSTSTRARQHTSLALHTCDTHSHTTKLKSNPFRLIGLMREGAKQILRRRTSAKDSRETHSPVHPSRAEPGHAIAIRAPRRLGSAPVHKASYPPRRMSSTLLTA
jgi:hypothetical protein